MATATAKRLIRLFGFPFHDAPGEAEAECALLQRQGIVDAVLSEDVDTIMFGCTRTLRNWSSESRTSKTPTHVSVYDLADMTLDREGMVLVALMSGGDYLPDGIPGCGVKVACEAAKAGYGKSLCRIKSSEGLGPWRQSLIHELKTNENGLFRTKHKALTIPENFPNMEVLRYYTHPVVSPVTTLDTVRQKMDQASTFHLEALREFTRENFGWDYRVGANKFIRVLGEARLVQMLSTGHADAESHVKRISGRRTHFSTDGTPELRLSYIPQDMVPIDLSQETEEVIAHARTGLALNSDDEMGLAEDATQLHAPKLFDVTKPDLAWVLEGLAQKSVPKAVQCWQEQERAKAIRKSPQKPRPKKPSKAATGMPAGSMDKYVRVTKAVASDDVFAPVKRVSPKLTPSRSMPPGQAQQSKQTSPTKSKSPLKVNAIQTIASSPPSARCSERERQFHAEAIIISSSPAPDSPACQSHAPSTPPSPSLRSTVPCPQSRAGGAKSQENVDVAKETVPVLKQSSMDAFVRKPEAIPRAQADETDESDLEPLAALAPPSTGTESSGAADSNSSPLLPPMQPTSSSMRQSNVKNDSFSRQDVVPSPSPKKKLFRARASMSGFFEEEELSNDLRDDAIVEGAKRGGKAVALRWSDVSVIDLTESS